MPPRLTLAWHSANVVGSGVTPPQPVVPCKPSARSAWDLMEGSITTPSPDVAREMQKQLPWFPPWLKACCALTLPTVSTAGRTTLLIVTNATFGTTTSIRIGSRQGTQR